jgi:hypothetical protein
MTAPPKRKSRPGGGGSDLGLAAFDRSNDNTVSRTLARAELPFADQRKAALTLLQNEVRLTRKAGSFLGQLCVDPSPMTEKQMEWLATLLERAELPPLEGHR